MLEIYEVPTETIVKVIAARLLTDCIVLYVFRVVSGRWSEFCGIHSLMLIRRVSGGSASFQALPVAVFPPSADQIAPATGL